MGIVQRKLLFKWLILFFLTNLAFYELIGLRYIHLSITNNLNFLTIQHKINLFLFISTMYFSYFFLITCFAFVIPVLCLFFGFHTRIFFSLSVFTSAMVAGFLLIDTFIYEYYRFHLNLFFLKLFFSFDNGPVFNITINEIVIAVAMVGVIFIIEVLCAKKVWDYLKNKRIAFKKYGYTGFLFLLMFYISYVSIFYVKYNFVLRIYLEEVRFLPGIMNILSLLAPGVNSTLALTKMGERFPTQSDQLNKSLFYPHHDLLFHRTSKPFNLLIILIDSWRYDTFNQEITPAIYNFSQKSLRFDNHLSGGNATGPGMFSMFYGLPSTYWTASLAQRRSPVFLDALQQTYHYKIFSSSQLYSPPLSKTIFQNITDLQINQQSGESPNARDAAITQQYKQWISENLQKQKPFFALLFYDAPHSYCDTDDHGPFYPNTLCNRLMKNNGEAIFNRYKNAAYFVDQQVKEVLETLVQKNLLKNTIVIITSDHGEEFDDNRLGYRGHASNYTNYQLHVPFIMYWPQQTPNIFHHVTTHYDIVPTLMKRLLGCTNPTTDFTVGMDLFDRQSRFPLVVGSYIDFGVLEADQVTRFDSVGSYRIEKPNGEVNSQGKLRMAVIREAMLDMRGFYSENRFHKKR